MKRAFGLALLAALAAAALLVGRDAPARRWWL